MERTAQYRDLMNEADAFSKGYRIALTGHTAIIKSFFSTIGLKARQLFHEIHKDITHWIEASLQPLAFQIEDHRDMLNRQIQDLKLATQSREMVDSRLSELAAAIEKQSRQVHDLDRFISTLANFHENTPRLKPYLVKASKEPQQANS
jgi:DNA repair exonuclease SbcCD ATPase subunit